MTDVLFKNTFSLESQICSRSLKRVTSRVRSRFVPFTSHQPPPKQKCIQMLSPFFQKDLSNVQFQIQNRLLYCWRTILHRTLGFNHVLFTIRLWFVTHHLWEVENLSNLRNRHWKHFLELFKVKVLIVIMTPTIIKYIQDNLFQKILV